MDTNKEVLCMYDVMGIQDYIFRTNKLKEVIGGSIIVENLVEKGIKDIVEKGSLFNKGQAVINWRDENNNPLPFEYDNNLSIHMEVLFIGGGNTYILFRNKDKALAFNRKLSKYVLDETYSLQLAISMVDKTENYLDDYNALNIEMRKVKARKAQAIPIGTFAVTKVENATGLPVYKEIIDWDIKNAKERERNKEHISRESYLKRENNDWDKTQLDAMVLEKGIDSNLAFVHIDGNSMGARIQKLMADEKNVDYKTAVEKMRAISNSISSSFEKVYEEMEETYIKKYHEYHIAIDPEREAKILDNPVFRKVILAGDDITFICNASIAFSAVKYFIEEVAKYTMWTGKDGTDYSFSACAGIAFANSHFPFSDAYIVAEECCSSAKKRGKEEDNRFDTENPEEKHIGSWIDFQICNHISSGDLKNFRNRNYHCADDTFLLMRPYCIGVGEYRKDEFDFERFLEKIVELKDLPRSKIKDLKNEYPKGKNAVKNLLSFLNSREIYLKEDLYKVDAKKNKISNYYDPLEMMDYYIDYIPVAIGEED